MAPSAGSPDRALHQLRQIRTVAMDNSTPVVCCSQTAPSPTQRAHQQARTGTQYRPSFCSSVGRGQNASSPHKNPTGGRHQQSSRDACQRVEGALDIVAETSNPFRIVGCSRPPARHSSAWPTLVHASHSFPGRPLPSPHKDGGTVGRPALYARLVDKDTSLDRPNGRPWFRAEHRL